MATPNVGILTTTGKALIDKVNSGQAKISFSKVVFSSMDNSQLSDTQIKALTAIAPQEVVVSSPQTTLDTNSGETRIRATGTNEKLADGVYVKTYGVFAKDDTGNEILYGVTVSPTPNYFPAYDGVTPQAVTYSYKTIIQETSNITMTNSNDVYVSQEDLTEAIAKIPQPDLSGYDKTDDVDKKLQNKQDKLGFTAADDSTVVHTADMRKPANDVAGIEEVNTKQDKIGYIPADDSKVVHDNKNGTEQLNGVQVQPFNKLSDTIGGRNYLINTQNPSATNPVKFVGVSSIDTSGTVTFSNGYTKVASIVSSTSSETFYRFSVPISTVMPLPSGTYTLVVDLTSSDNVYVAPKGQYSTGQYYPNGSSKWNNMVVPFWALSSTEKQFSYTFTIPSNATGWFISLEMYADINGTIDNTGKSFQFGNASIQKGSVAIDSSPAPEDKQDKIGYTPADDSTVLHNNALNQILTDNSGIIIGNDKDFGFIKRQNYKGGLAIGSGNSFHFLATNDAALSNTSEYHDVWNILHNGQVSILDGAYFTPADDSKVAHLSGTNNFDTVPTVKNNPLLLASSLPSDLARTGQDANFTGKLQQNGQDVALANNTIDRNPDTGTVSKPTDFTNLTVNGGKSVATRDDLKSLEASAWRPLTLENANNGTILFKDNGDGTASLTGSANFVIAAAPDVITEAIDPPSGYQFSSLAWNKGTNGDGIFAIADRSGTTTGTVYTPTALIQNGKICFKNGSYSYPELMFSPCLNTTDKTSSSCEPAIVLIKRV